MSDIQKKVTKRLQKIDSISLSLSQFTIDTVADCLDIAVNSEDYMPRLGETLGSKSYKIDVVLDIMDPKFEEDIVVLKEIISLFREWQIQTQPRK